jgi:transcriptional regulator with XRE-family HTH domain
LVIRHRLKELGLDQRELAAAADVTESYVSQLLARKKAPPAPRRTAIYNKMEGFLRLPRGELSRLAEVQRKEELKKKAGGPVLPLFRELRGLMLKKCRSGNRVRIRAILEKEPFGELERLVAQKLLDVAKGVAKTGATLRKLLGADVFSASVETCIPFLDSLIESWNIDLETFAIEIILNRGMSPDGPKRFEFVEQGQDQSTMLEPGLKEFLSEKSLSGDATKEEIDFLKRLNLKGRRPAPIYYYRELQNLRDPVHFRD